jgi:hypothetical protein
MDADENGIPCQTVYPAEDIAFLLGSVDEFGSGLLCRDLADRGATFGQAVAYWVAEGGPERMDADGNGTPCETVYEPEEVADFIWFDR